MPLFLHVKKKRYYQPHWSAEKKIMQGLRLREKKKTRERDPSGKGGSSGISFDDTHKER